MAPGGNRKIALWLAGLAVCVVPPLVIGVWLVQPGGARPEEIARLDRLKERIAEARSAMNAAAPDASMAGTVPGELAGEHFRGIMADYEAWRDLRSETERQTLLREKAGQARVLSRIYEDGVRRLGEDLRAELSDEQGVYLQNVARRLIHEAGSGREETKVLNIAEAVGAPDTEAAADVGRMLEEAGVSPSGADGAEGGPTGDLLQIPMAVGVVENELEQLAQAARFLRMIDYPLWLNPVTEKLEWMLAPPADTPKERREKWRTDLESYELPVELIAPRDPWRWGPIAARYLERRLKEIEADFIETATWPGIRRHARTEGAGGTIGEWSDGFFIKLDRRRNFNAGAGWIEATLDRLATAETFEQLAPEESAHARLERAALADFARPLVRDRLVAAAYLLRRGEKPPTEAGADSYFHDPYSGGSVRTESAGGAAGGTRALIVCVGPDGRTGAERKDREDDIVIAVDLDSQ